MRCCTSAPWPPGIISLPTSPQLTAEEVSFLIEDSGARAVAMSDALAVDLPSAVARISPDDVARWRAEASPAAYGLTRADDPAFLVYTSGTTGRPKGVLHAHRSAWGRRPMHDAWLGLREGDVLLHAGRLQLDVHAGRGADRPVDQTGQRR